MATFMPTNVVRSALRSAVRLAIRLAASLGVDLSSKLSFNFFDEVYETNNTESTFSDSITHSASTNGTMTGGYGAELVANGTFDTDTSGWDYPAFDTATWDNGTARIDRGASGNGSAIYQSGATSGVV